MQALGLQQKLQDRGFTEFKLRHAGRYDLVIQSFKEDRFSFLHKDASWLPLVQELLGKDCKLVHTGVMLSLPGSLNQPWHSDGPHLDTKRHLPPHCVNVFVPLVDLCRENGPTEFTPTTHIKWNPKVRALAGLPSRSLVTL